jgi:hypothetical protein
MAYFNLRMCKAFSRYCEKPAKARWVSRDFSVDVTGGRQLLTTVYSCQATRDRLHHFFLLKCVGVYFSSSPSLSFILR